MLANLAELVASVRSLINETTEGFWLTSEIEDFLNEVPRPNACQSFILTL